MFGKRNVEEEIKTKDKTPKSSSKQQAGSSNGIGFNSVSMDSHLYNQAENKQAQRLANFKGFDLFEQQKNTSKNSDDEQEQDNEQSFRKSMKDKYATQQQLLSESADLMEKLSGDPFEQHRSRTIADRENDYVKRWRKRKLSPERIDPFKQTFTPKSEQDKKRSYSEILQETSLEREKNEAMFAIQKKQKEIEFLKRQKEKPLAPEQQAELDKKRKASESDEPPHKKQRTESWGKPDEAPAAVDLSHIPKEQPNFKRSGKLDEAALTTSSGVVLKWSDPAEARVSKKRYRLYIFKGGEQAQEPVLLTKQPSYMFGKEKTVADVLLEHPSCSKQHAVICFRQTEKKDKHTLKNKTKIRPYIMDLKSTNGTFLNGEKLEDSRFYEMREKDVIKFGNSTREYVFLCEDVTAE